MSSSKTFKLTDQESMFYNNLWQIVNPENAPLVKGKECVAFLKKSGLSVDTLKQIWMISAKNVANIDKEEFYIALKLISFSQNGVEPNLENLNRVQSTILPRLQFENNNNLNNVQINQQQIPNYNLSNSRVALIQTNLANNLDVSNEYGIPQEQMAKYDQYFSIIDQNNKGNLSGQEAKVIFGKSGISREQLI